VQASQALEITRNPWNRRRHAAGDAIEGLTVASAGGHGMMWGPAVARCGADLATTGRTDVVDVGAWGLDRFDALGRSRLAPDPIALPLPRAAPEDQVTPA